jgi:hypothetical protein
MLDGQQVSAKERAKAIRRLLDEGRPAFGMTGFLQFPERSSCAVRTYDNAAVAWH